MSKNVPHSIYLKDYHVPEYIIDKVNLEFELDSISTVVKSCLTIHANPLSKQIGKDVVLYGEMLELVLVKLDDKILMHEQYQVTDESLTIFNVPKNCNLEIHTKIKPQENTELSGLYQSNGNFCTQCEAEGFRRITYFLDRPDVMARYSTTIIAPEKLFPVLLSNGNLIEEGKLSGNRHFARWEDPFKKPCYLFALVAGNLTCIEDFFITTSGKSVTLRIYVEKGNQDKCAYAMKSLKKAMQWDEEKFGREYDLDIYMIVAVSDFNMGAMENKGLNIFNTKYILATPEMATDQDFINVDAVVAHEYFHNWTGNRITCRDWFQLSLKEGLTVFREQSFTADHTSTTVKRIQDANALRTTQFIEDAGPLAHPVRPDSYIEINNFYTTTIYEKGAEVIRMIKTILGETLFRQGMDLYFDRHDGQAVTTEDFVKAMEDASLIDLAQFRLWYSQAGTPVLHVQDEYDAEQKRYTLTITQVIPDTPGQKDKKPMHIPVKIGLLDRSGKELKHALLHLHHESDSFQFENMANKPIPSLLRDFSAPVKVRYHYTNDDLQLLFKYDKDLFNRWDAGQNQAIHLMLNLIKMYHRGEKLILPDDFVDGFAYALQTVDDKLLLAEMLMLPSEKYLSEQLAVIDVDAVNKVREFVSLAIASQLKNVLISIYHQNSDDKKRYQFTIDEVGRRQLKNSCLSYVMMLNDAEIIENLGVRQFNHALNDNMTDTMAALKCLTHIDSEHREFTLKQFYSKWQNEALLMDKWFAIQAMSKLPKTLSVVKQLTNHPAFDIKNPNKVYSLVGTFCHHNPVNFHSIDGAGYAFLADIVLRLDALNPQVASRMLTPLTQWMRYDETRKNRMREQLERISHYKTLSRDVYELVSKSL